MRLRSGLPLPLPNASFLLRRFLFLPLPRPSAHLPVRRFPLVSRVLYSIAGPLLFSILFSARASFHSLRPSYTHIRVPFLSHRHSDSHLLTCTFFLTLTHSHTYIHTHTHQHISLSHTHTLVTRRCGPLARLSHFQSDSLSRGARWHLIYPIEGPR